MADAMRAFREASPALAVLARDVRVRILNCSASGCLLETTGAVDVGTIGSLSLRIGDDEVSDAIRVVRCQPIEGAGSLFHVGAEFLWTDSPKPTALRRFVHRAAGHVQGVRASIGP